MLICLKSQQRTRLTTQKPMASEFNFLFYFIYLFYQHNIFYLMSGKSDCSIKVETCSVENTCPSCGLSTFSSCLQLPSRPPGVSIKTLVLLPPDSLPSFSLFSETHAGGLSYLLQVTDTHANSPLWGILLLSKHLTIYYCCYY